MTAAMTVVPPGLQFVFEGRFDVGIPVDVGAVVGGRRRLVPITGGTFAGPELNGAVLQGGTDYQLLHPDGFTELEARYVLVTEQQDKIFVVNRGVRSGSAQVLQRLNAGAAVDPALIYFRTSATLQAASPQLGWMNHSLFIGVGTRLPQQVLVQFFRVL